MPLLVSPRCLAAARVALAVLCVIVSVFLVSPMGFGPGLLRRLTSVLLLLIVVVLYLPQVGRRGIWSRRVFARYALGIGLILAGVAGVLSTPLMIEAAALPVFLFGLWVFLDPPGPLRRELLVLGAGALASAVFSLLLLCIPPLWIGIQQLSLTVSSGVGGLLGRPLAVGPMVSGLYAVLLAVIFLAVGIGMIPASRMLRYHWGLTCICLAAIAWLCWLASLAFAFPTTAEVEWRAWLFLGICLVFPIVLYLRLGVYAGGFQEPFSPVVWRPRGMVASALVVILLGSSMVVLTYSPVSSQKPGEQVVFYAQHMVGTWDVPSYASFGRVASGMFGLLPQYLAASGYQVTLLVQNATRFPQDSRLSQVESFNAETNFSSAVTLRQTTEVSEADLADASVLVVINLNVSFSAREQATIWGFVQRGGGLWVLGDHTNAGGIRQPLNDLLAPVDIRLRFDAALPYNEQSSWEANQRLLAEPLGLWAGDDLKFPWGVGASLDVGPSGIPVIVGTCVLSDNGNASNQGSAFLGDYAYTPGEQAGDVVVTAAAYYGNGRVMVWGDTSAVQNPVLSSSYPSLLNVVHWLGGSSSGQGLMNVLLGGVVLLAAAGLMYWVGRPRLPLVAFAVAVAGGLLISLVASSPVVAVPRLGSNEVVVDVSHGERFSRDAMMTSGVSGLVMNLERKSLLPLYGSDPSFGRLAGAAFVFLIAPTQGLSPGQVQALRDYMRDGGHVVVSCGYEEQGATAPLLSACGVAIEEVPLGPVPYLSGTENETLQQPRFVDSWPILFSAGQARSFYNFTYANETYHLVVYVPQGQGGLLVIADSRFLLDSNLESLYDYWPGNILFLKNLLEEVHGGAGV